MVLQLRTLAAEVTRVTLEVGSQGKLGGMAEVPGVEGVWRELTYNVNQMCSNLTNQVRSIAIVTTAVAQGDLTQKVGIQVRIPLPSSFVLFADGMIGRRRNGNPQRHGEQDGGPTIYVRF